MSGLISMFYKSWSSASATRSELRPVPRKGVPVMNGIVFKRCGCSTVVRGGDIEPVRRPDGRIRRRGLNGEGAGKSIHAGQATKSISVEHLYHFRNPTVQPGLEICTAAWYALASLRKSVPRRTRSAGDRQRDHVRSPSQLADVDGSLRRPACSEPTIGNAIVGCVRMGDLPDQRGRRLAG